MEGQLPAVVAARQGQLFIQAFRVHTDAHAADFQGALQGLVPEKQVAV